MIADSNTNAGHAESSATDQHSAEATTKEAKEEAKDPKEERQEKAEKEEKEKEARVSPNTRDSTAFRTKGQPRHQPTATVH